MCEGVPSSGRGRGVAAGPAGDGARGGGVTPTGHPPTAWKSPIARLMVEQSTPNQQTVRHEYGPSWRGHWITSGCVRSSTTSGAQVDEAANSRSTNTSWCFAPAPTARFRGREASRPGWPLGERTAAKPDWSHGLPREAGRVGRRLAGVQSVQDIPMGRRRRGFLGREAERAAFTENFAFAPEDDRHRFPFHIHGDAGVGKTLRSAHHHRRLICSPQRVERERPEIDHLGL